MQIKFAGGVRFSRAAMIAAVAVTVCVAQGCTAGPTIGDTVNIADNALACINYDDLNKLLSLRRAEDEEAFLQIGYFCQVPYAESGHRHRGGHPR